MPRTVRYFRIFCGFLVATYLILSVIGIVFVFSPEGSTGFSRQISLLLGILFILVGLLFAAITVPGFYLPRRPGAWTYGHLLICLGLTSVVLLPIAAPLLYFWFKPPVKAWFEAKGS